MIELGYSRMPAERVLHWREEIPRQMFFPNDTCTYSFVASENIESHLAECVGAGTPPSGIELSLWLFRYLFLCLLLL